MALIKYEVANLPEETVGHNLGDVLGIVWFGKKLENADYTDDHAKVVTDLALPYFKIKANANVVPVGIKSLPVVSEKIII